MVEVLNERNTEQELQVQARATRHRKLVHK